MRRTVHGILSRLSRRLVARLGTARSVLTGAVAALALLFAVGGENALQRELDCLARNVYFEARLEPEAGRRAVAHVVLNRVADSRWPDTPCRVVAEGVPDAGRLCQFSWYCDDRPNRPRPGADWRDATQLARQVYRGQSSDPTGGALWYHADYVDPEWRHALRRGPQIGRHIFYYDPADADTGALPPVAPADP